MRAQDVHLPLPSSVTIYGDSLLIINQVQGLWEVRAHNLFGLVAGVQDCTQELQVSLRAVVQTGVVPQVRWAHIGREHNKRADALSNVAMDAHVNPNNPDVTSYGHPYRLGQLVELEACHDAFSVVEGRRSGLLWSSDVALAHLHIPDEYSEESFAGAQWVPGQDAFVNVLPPGGPETDLRSYRFANMMIQNNTYEVRDGNGTHTTDTQAIIDDMFSWEDGSMEVRV
jgi:hypothetical protein